MESVLLFWFKDKPGTDRYSILSTEYVLQPENASQTYIEDVICDKTPAKAHWMYGVAGVLKDGGIHPCLILNKSGEFSTAFY